ncbi:MAG: IS607 family element RNA-guided endonuclease TnpB [Solirubrobacteraceae bacterium]
MRVTQAYRFALDPTPAQERKLRSHCGASRFGYNWALGLVKARLDQRERVRLAARVEQLPDAEVERLARTVALPWTLAELRREWNAAKARVAPWWAQNSKEAASSGFLQLAAGLDAWSKSRRGERRGARVGFPRFKRRGWAGESFRYTTGRFGVASRVRVQLPRVGHVRTHESTARLAGKLADDRGRVLSMTVSCQGGRWFCSLCCVVDRDDRPARARDTVVGVDVGIKHLAVLSTGELIANPRALEGAQRRLRRHQRRVDRQRRQGNPGCYDERGRAIKGRRPSNRSARQRRTERRVARVHARAANIRRDVLHKLTSRLAAEHATIVVEHLNVAGMLSNRCLARALSDAGLAEIRRQLAYKTAWRAGTLVQAPTFYPSSKTCSNCQAVKAKLSLSERTYRCERCGLQIDRDLNAALNLKALAQHVAPSGGETINARSRPSAAGVPRTHVRPGRAGRRVDREARTAPARIRRAPPPSNRRLHEDRR